MEPLQKTRSVNGQVSFWQVCLVVLAISAISVSLATRVCHIFVHHGSASVQSDTEQATRQHMNLDGVEWVPPVSVHFALLEVSFYPRISPAGLPVLAVLLDESLYNRPPPSC